MIRQVLGADGVGDVFFSEGTTSSFLGRWLGNGSAVIFDGAADGTGNLFSARVGKTHIQHTLVVVGRALNGSVDCFEDVWFDHLSLPEDLNTGAVAIENVTVLDKLLKLDLGHLHQPVHFVLGALEILDAEGVDGHVGHAGLVADFQDLEILSVCWIQIHGLWVYPSESLEAQVVSFDRLHAVSLRKSAVAIHHKGNMFGNRSLTQCAY